jgi:hypothetical protein
VNVVDRTAPEIQLLGKNPLTVARFSHSIDDPGVKLNDNYYSDAVLRGLLVTNSASVDLSRPGYYFITYNVTDPSGNMAQTAQRLIQVVESTTGINELAQDQSIMVYPNPSNGIFMVSSTKNPIRHVKVMDMLGRTVLEKNIDPSNAMIDLQASGKGVYMIIAEDTDGNSYMNKAVVE